MNIAVSIILSHPAWMHRQGCYVRGFAFYGGELFQEDKLAALFLACDTEDLFRQKLNDCNGQFSVVIQKKEALWLGVDKLRHYPLFYTNVAGSWQVADNTSAISGNKKTLNREMLLPFLLCGYCTGNKTLSQHVWQVEAGAYSILSGLQPHTNFYYQYFGRKKTMVDFATAKQQLAAILNEVMADYVEMLAGSTIVVTLSGGYDSRLLLTLLKQHGYKHVVAVTYGRKGLPEVATAKKAAEQLSFKWVCIEYDGLVQKDILRDKAFLAYYQYAANDVSMFYLQDYFAVKYLQNNGLLAGYPRPVFMPGYSGDFLAGAHLSLDLNTRQFDKKALINALQKKHFFYLGYTASETKMQVDSKIEVTAPLPWSNFENWEMKERQAKFIVNSGKVFNFFGYDYVTPLWDDRLKSFFRDLPFEWKYEQKLYKETLEEFFFKPHNLLFPEDSGSIHRKMKWQEFKNKVKSWLPGFVVNAFTDNSDWYCYAEVIALMKQQKEHPPFIAPRQLNYHNAYLMQWYLMQEYSWNGKIERSDC